MNRLSTKEIFSMMILFILGTSVLTGYWFYTAKNPIFILISFVASIIPIILSLILLIKYNKDMYSIIFSCFNKYISIIISIFFIIYAIILEAIHLKFFALFTKSNILTKTPIIVTIIIFLLLIFLTLKEGIITLGKISTFLLPINLLIVFFCLLFPIKMFNINNINEILNFSIYNEINRDILFNSLLPYSDIFLFSFIVNKINKNKNIKKTYIIGISVSYIIILLTYLTDVLLLGFPLVLKTQFPNFITVGVSSIGSYISRMEIIVAFNFFITTLIKISIYAYVALLGIKKIFNLRSTKRIGIFYSIFVFFVISILPQTTSKIIVVYDNFRWFLFFVSFILPIIILIKKV